MKRMVQRLAFVAFSVLVLNIGWNVTGSLAITPNSPAPVVYTVVGG